MDREPVNRGERGGAIGPVMPAEAVEVEPMVLSRKHWDRLKSEATEAKMGWTDLLLGAAFAFLGVAAAAALTAWQVPVSDASASNAATQISPATKTDLWIIAGGALLVALAFFAGWLGQRKDHNASLDRLVLNMESHEHAAQSSSPAISASDQT